MGRDYLCFLEGVFIKDPSTNPIIEYKNSLRSNTAGCGLSQIPIEQPPITITDSKHCIKNLIFIPYISRGFEPAI